MFRMSGKHLAGTMFAIASSTVSFSVYVALQKICGSCYYYSLQQFTRKPEMLYMRSLCEYSQLLTAIVHG